MLKDFDVIQKLVLSKDHFNNKKHYKCKNAILKQKNHHFLNFPKFSSWWLLTGLWERYRVREKQVYNGHLQLNSMTWTLQMTYVFYPRICNICKSSTLHLALAAEKTGLRISREKTKVMRANSKRLEKIKLRDAGIRGCSNFYLFRERHDIRRRCGWRCKKQDRQSKAGLQHPKTSVELNINIH